MHILKQEIKLRNKLGQQYYYETKEDTRFELANAGIFQSLSRKHNFSQANLQPKGYIISKKTTN